MSHKLASSRLFKRKSASSRLAVECGSNSLIGRTSSDIAARARLGEAAKAAPVIRRFAPGTQKSEPDPCGSVKLIGRYRLQMGSTAKKLPVSNYEQQHGTPNPLTKNFKEELELNREQSWNTGSGTDQRTGNWDLTGRPFASTKRGVGGSSFKRRKIACGCRASKALRLN